MKKKYIKLPPQLVDGGHWAIADIIDDPDILGEGLTSWAKWGQVGESITLEIIEMTDEEFEALPEI